MEVSTIGLDLAKNVLPIHGVDASGRIVIRRAIRRSQVLPFFAKLPPCLVGIEACGTPHHWARGLLSLGFFKTDAADAAAICEAVTRPTMRFVPVKSREQQAILSLHRTRDLLVKQRTQLVNMMRGQLAEFGINIPQGLERALMLARQIVEGKEVPDLPGHAVKMLAILSRQTLAADEQIREINRDLLVLQKSDEMARRLATIPGVGPIGATAFAAAVTDPGQFRSGRQFAAWLGLTPLQNSSGGKERLGRINKMGDKYLRRLLVIGATALVRQFRNRPDKATPHFASLLARKPVRVATVAMANKMARIVWALMTRGETYRAAHIPILAA